MISHQIIYYKIIPSLHYTEAQLLQTVCIAGTDGQIIKQIIKSGKLQIIIFSCNTSCMMETYNGSTNVANSLCCGELMVKLSRLADGAKHAIATLTTQTPKLG